MLKHRVLGNEVLRGLKEETVGDTFSPEEFWACHYGLMKSLCDMKEQEKINNNENYSDIEKFKDELYFNAVRLFTCLPKYSQVFETNDFDKALEQYKTLVLKEIPLNIENDENGICKMAQIVTAYAVENRLVSKNSGINIKRNAYDNALEDYERDSSVISGGFLDTVAESWGEEARQSALKHIQNEGIESIQETLKYFSSKAKYLCGFVANIEIAREEEEERDRA